MPFCKWQVAKGDLDRVDDVCNGDRRDEFLEQLKAGISLVDVADKFEIVRNGAEKRHLEREFFRDWWRTAQDMAGGSGVEKVFREGLIQALENSNGLPIDCYHAWYPAEDGEVTAAICRSENQVTFFLHTPRPVGPSQSCPDEIIIVNATAERVEVNNLGIR